MNDLLDTLMERSLRFEYLSGGVTPIRSPHSTGWRTLPSLTITQTRRGRTRVYLEGAEPQDVPPRGLIVIPAGTHHRIDLVTPDGQSNWVHVNYLVLGDLDLFAFLSVKPVHTRSLGDRVGDSIAECMSLLESTELHTVSRIAGVNEFGYRILGQMADIVRPAPGARARVDALQLVRPLLEHVHQNLDASMSRDDLCRVAGMSHAGLHRAFRQCIGMPPAEYVRRTRLQHARRLLISTDLSVKEVATRVGYADPFVFSRFFKRASGTSPRAYRDSVRSTLT